MELFFLLILSPSIFSCEYPLAKIGNEEASEGASSPLMYSHPCHSNLRGWMRLYLKTGVDHPTAGKWEIPGFTQQWMLSRLDGADQFLQFDFFLMLPTVLSEP